MSDILSPGETEKYPPLTDAQLEFMRTVVRGGGRFPNDECARLLDEVDRLKDHLVTLAELIAYKNGSGDAPSDREIPAAHGRAVGVHADGRVGRS